MRSGELHCEERNVVAAYNEVFVTTAEGTQNNLSSGADFALEEGEDEPDATIFSKEDLTLNGNGSLEIRGDYKNGVTSKDDLVIGGGTLVVTAADNGLKGKDCVKMADGTVTVTAGGDGVKSTNDEDTARGFVSIDGGTLTVDAGDDGVDAQWYFRVMDGTVNVTSADDAFHRESDGLIGGGTITVSEDCLIQINGGTIYVTAGGDGLDSNGNIELNGGVVYVSGPTNSGNGAIDYELGATSNGGTIIAAGPAGMAAGFSGGSTPFAMANASGNGGQTIAVVGANGQVLASMEARNPFQSVVIASPDFTEGETVSIVVGGTVSGADAQGVGGTVSGGSSVEATVSTTATQSGMGSMGGGRGMRG